MSNNPKSKQLSRYAQQVEKPYYKAFDKSKNCEVNISGTYYDYSQKLRVTKTVAELLFKKFDCRLENRRLPYEIVEVIFYKEYLFIDPREGEVVTAQKKAQLSKYGEEFRAAVQFLMDHQIPFLVDDDGHQYSTIHTYHHHEKGVIVAHLDTRSKVMDKYWPIFEINKKVKKIFEQFIMNSYEFRREEDQKLIIEVLTPTTALAKKALVTSLFLGDD